MPQCVEANSYFLTAEALTNAVKHARATRVDVSMKSDGRALISTVAIGHMAVNSS
jgi:signal transduction histidine kinase